MGNKYTRPSERRDGHAADHGFSDRALRLATYGVLAVFFLLALIAIYGVIVLHQ